MGQFNHVCKHSTATFAKKCGRREVDESKDNVATPNQFDGIKHCGKESYQSSERNNKDGASRPANFERTTSQKIASNRDLPVINRIQKPSSSANDEYSADTTVHRPASADWRENHTRRLLIPYIDERTTGLSGNINSWEPVKVSHEIHCDGKAGDWIQANQASFSTLSAMDEEEGEDESHLPVAPFDDPDVLITSVSTTEVTASRPKDQASGFPISTAMEEEEGDDKSHLSVASFNEPSLYGKSMFSVLSNEVAASRLQNQAICSSISAMDEVEGDDESHLPVAPFDYPASTGTLTTSILSTKVLTSRLRNGSICCTISAMDEEEGDDESHLPVAPFIDPILPCIPTTSVSLTEVPTSRLRNKHSFQLECETGLVPCLVAEDSDSATAQGKKNGPRSSIKQWKMISSSVKRFFRQAGDDSRVM